MAASSKLSDAELQEVYMIDIQDRIAAKDQSVVLSLEELMAKTERTKEVLALYAQALVNTQSSEDIAKAAEIADEVVALAPEWPDAHLAQGCVLTAQRDFAAAERALRRGELLCKGIRTARISAALGHLAKMRLESIADTVGSAAGAASPSEATPADLPEDREADKFDGLEHWMASDTDNNTHFPYLYMKKYMEGNRGVHCTSTVEAETEILSIDRKFLITVEMGRACPIGRKIAMASPPLVFSASKHCYTSVFILWDRLNEESFFQPYYKILPQELTNMPLFWNEEQLEWLTGSYLLQQVSDRKENIKRDYEQILTVAPELAEIASLHDFMWARMIVASRNFGVTVDGRKTDAMVPYADMLNHYRPRETKWTFNSLRQCFTITSTTTLLKGQQVYDSYGKKCNSRFLLNYGFAVEHNRDDDSGQNHNEVRLVLSMEPPAVDPWFQHKLSQLLRAGIATGSALNSGTANGIPWRAVRVSTFYEHDSTREAFSWMRFVYATQAQLGLLPAFRRDSDLYKNPVPPISTENEVQVLQKLAEYFKAQYEGYPTTLEADIEELATGKHSFGGERRNALVVIKGEKEVCRFYMALADIAVPMLQSTWAEQQVVIQQQYCGHDDVDRYVRACVAPLLQQKLAEAQFVAAGQSGGAPGYY